MDADLDLLLISAYCTADDLLPQHPRARIAVRLLALAAASASTTSSVSPAAPSPTTPPGRVASTA
jgi:hypothetical protein